MRKSTIFVSVVLTTFALAMLYGVVYAYRAAVGTSVNSVSKEQAAPVALPVNAPLGPTDSQSVNASVGAASNGTLSPEQAAQVAAQVLGRNDLLSAESASVNGVNAYKIIFAAGDVVFVGLDGQILSVQTVQPTAQPAFPSANAGYQPPRTRVRGGGGGGGGGGGVGGGGGGEGGGGDD